MNARAGFVRIGYRAHGLQRVNITTGEAEIFERNSKGGLESNGISAIRKVDDNELAISTFGGGLYIIDQEGKILEKFKHDPAKDSSLSSNKIHAINQISTSEIVVGTIKGIDVLNYSTQKVKLIDFSSPTGEFVETAPVMSP